MKKNSTYLSMILSLSLLVTISSCKKDDPAPVAVKVYSQEDQMARPAINTVFVSTGEKDMFNQTIPSTGAATWGSKFNTKLLALNAGYTTNLLGLSSTAFTGVLAADVLTASLTKPTTFYDGTNVLTGRKLDDDVITVELTLIFGGAKGDANPGLTDDHVNANDKSFLTTFPYLASPW
jgi:Domain of unknown function (DUF4331)